jgi:hypothetical protein
VNGAELLAYVKRRLRLEGVTIEAQGAEENTLFDYLTEGRDTLLQVFAKRAPVLVQELVALQVDPADSRLYNFPAATTDPLACISLRSVTTREPLIPSAETMLDTDAGEYEWLSPRQVRLAEHVDPPGGLEGFFVLTKPAITAVTTEAGVGLPVPTHRCLGKYAALLHLTADEESDAANAEKLFTQELDRLIKLYAQFDRHGGEALRQAFLSAYGDWMADSLY